MTDQPNAAAWESLWRQLERLEGAARTLRRLSQEEPLLQARPDYPRPPAPRRSYADELRETLERVREGVAEVRRLLAEALPPGTHPAGLLPEEMPDALDHRLAGLAKLADTLLVEAFEPPPPLPKHAPPYVLEAPRHDLAGSKAIFLSYGLEDAAASIRNALLSRANTTAAPGASA
ncbi:MAG TPA: hypothetical protein VKZ50_14790 [bacterium]|nr:hypothetical protein [bacterium]